MFPSLRRAVGAPVLAAALLVLTASCESNAVRYGQVSLGLTDAPGDVLQAVVTIEQIYVQPGGDSGASRFVIRDTPFTTDLLTLVDSTAVLLEDVDVPVGSYGQLRFVISGGFIAVEQPGGDTAIYASSPTYAGLPEGVVVTGQLQMPSYAQSGLKVQLPSSAIVIVEDSLVVITVDFDVAQSFGQAAGGSGTWVMTPVVHALPPEPPAP